MWIERVDVRGFRGLSGEFTFSPTLTLVIGDNEAGKSSLHEALVRGLFGFSRVERRRSRGSSLLERRAPWHGGPYGLVARLRNRERSYRVEWDYAKHRVSVVDDLGHDLSAEIGAGRDEVELGEHFLGIGIDDFRQVCCIDQGELSAVGSSPTLGVALQEAVAKVGGGVPVAHAVERLNDYLRSIGARTDNLRPSPAGRLMALARERAQLDEQLRAAEEARKEIERLARDAALARDELTRLEAERDRTRQRLLADDAHELEQRLGEARRLDQQSRDRPEQIPMLTGEVVEEVRLVLTRTEELEGELASAEQPAEDARRRVAELEGEQRVLTTAVDGLEPYADIDTSARDEVRTGSSQLERLESDALELTGRLAEATNGRAAGEPADGLEPAIAEEVRLARGRILELADERASVENAVAAAAGRVAELEGIQRSLQTAVDGLGAYAGVDASARDDVREAWAQVEALASTAAPTKLERFEPDPHLAAYRADRDALLIAATGQERPSGRRWLRITLDVLTLGVAWLVRRLVRQRREARATATFSERLERYGGTSIDELNARVAEEDRKRLRIEAASEALQRAYAETEERRSALAARVLAALDRVGAPAGSDIGQRVRAYLTAVERHEQLADRQTNLAVVERELEQERQPLRDQRRLTQEHERALSRLRDAYAAAGINEDDLELAAGTFERLVTATEQARTREQKARAATEELRRSQVEADERRRATASQVEAALDRVGAPPAAELEQRVHAYLTAVERHEQLTEQKANLAHIERELEQARHPIREHRRLVQEHERTISRLREAYAAAGIGEKSLPLAADAFERLVNTTEDARVRDQKARAAAGALRSLLGDESLEMLESRAADARRQYYEHLQAAGELPHGQDGTREQINSEFATLDDRVREKIGETRALEARVAQREEQAGDPAPLKERIAAIDSQLERLNEAKEGVALARTVLEEAADELQREFAPYLNEALERNLARVTGGRYAKAFVDGELNVQVEIREDGGLKPADELSRATKDQLFLIERLEIVRLLGPTKGAAPLLLDDPFAHYDRARLQRGLEVIVDAAQERQVIVFSEDRDLIDLARDLCATCNVIELPSP